MTVYRGYIKIIKQNKALILLYLVIFFGVTMIFQAANSKDSYSGYQSQSLNIGIVDEDGGAAAQSLSTYLEHFHKVIPMENDTAKLQEDLFYRNIDYILRIPSGFFDSCIVQNQALDVTKVPGSYSGFYVDQQINSFIHTAKAYYAAGFSQEELSAAASVPAAADITLVSSNSTDGERPGFSFYFRYIPYLFLCILCYVLGNVLSAFRKGDLPKRMAASAISARRQNMEGLAAAATFSALLWILTIAVGVIVYADSFWQNSSGIYYILNSAAMLLVALSLSWLVGTLTKNINTLSGVVNVLSLGMCFLCGVFVPLEYMSRGVKNAAQFLPVYWYEHVIDLLGEYGTITGDIRAEVLQGLGLQLVFAAALVCITLAVTKKRRAL